MVSSVNRTERLGGEASLVGKHGSKRRGPRTAFSPLVSKTPRIGAPVSSYDQRPAWRVSSIEMIGPWGWQAIDPATILGIIRKLSEFERLMWKEIFAARNQGNHRVSVD